MIYYTVYRTQNIVNGKYYFGVHKTKNPYDDYIGSGILLGHAIAKYGRQSFIKNVCFKYDNAQEAFSKEAELIELYRHDPQCYNLRQGGSGGFDYINQLPLDRTDRGQKGKLGFRRRFFSDKSLRDAFYTRRHNLTDEERAKGLLKAVTARAQQWKGGRHTEATRSLMSTAQTGSKNSSFGSRWMNKSGVSKKVKASDVQVHLDSDWSFGRM